MEAKRQVRAVAVMSIFAALIVIAMLVSLNTGYIRLSPLEVLKTFMGQGTDEQRLVLFDFRMPRIVIAVLVGAGLAVSGAILQGVSRNALADPGILGINSGSGLAVILYIAFFPVASVSTVLFLPFTALVGAAAAAALIYLFSFKRGEGITPVRLLLVGIAVAAGINAAIIVLSIRLDPNDFMQATIWLAGSIWGTNWKFVLALLPWIIVLIPYTFYKSRYLNVLGLGDDAAVNLGTAVERERLKLLAVSVGLAGSCVAVGGGIGFIGLIGPHLARKLVGPRHQYLLPASALAGGLLLVVSDLLARNVLQPSEIPTGIVVSVIGAPYFLYLLARTRG